MIDLILIIPVLISFFTTLFLMPFWIKKARDIGLLWEEMNKINAEKVAGSGGIIAVLGFIVGTLIYIAYRVFYLQASNDFLIAIFALITVILILAGIGLVDDLLGWQRGGLSIRSRLILILFAAVPLVVINAGESSFSLPFLGTFNLGIFYPLIIIPIGIVGAATTFNMLAGYNGLEAGQGILLLSALGFAAYITGNSWLAFVSLLMIICLLAFLLYNLNPSKVFPGDSLTYAIGGLIAIIAILGNLERLAVFIYIPYILEVFFKLRGGLKKQSFGKPNKDGTLDLRYNKIYGLEHLSIWLMKYFGIKPTENKVVYSIWAFQFLIIIIGFILFKGIFT